MQKKHQLLAIKQCGKCHLLISSGLISGFSLEILAGLHVLGVAGCVVLVSLHVVNNACVSEGGAMVHSGCLGKHDRAGNSTRT